MAFRAEGLSATDAYAALTRKMSMTELKDGTFIASIGKSAHLESRLLGDGTLFIDSTGVSESLRRTGVSQMLFDRTLAQVGKQNVSRIQSYFGPGTNLDIARRLG
jgi:predicted GNAT family acetyltransferase